MNYLVCSFNELLCSFLGRVWLLLSKKTRKRAKLELELGWCALHIGKTAEMDFFPSSIPRRNCKHTVAAISLCLYLQASTPLGCRLLWKIRASTLRVHFSALLGGTSCLSTPKTWTIAFWGIFGEFCFHHWPIGFVQSLKMHVQTWQKPLNHAQFPWSFRGVGRKGKGLMWESVESPPQIHLGGGRNMDPQNTRRKKDAKKRK